MNRLGTKAETLRKLYQKMRYAEVLPQYVFTVKEWKEDPQKVKKGFLSLDWNKNVIVRSSSLAEDTDDNSFAGKYELVGLMLSLLLLLFWYVCVHFYLCIYGFRALFVLDNHLRGSSLRKANFPLSAVISCL